MESLKLEIETRECVQTKGSFKESSSDTRKPGYGKNTSIPQTSAALLGGNSAPDCNFCRGKQPFFDCHVVTNLQERKNILRKTGRCFLCLRRGSTLAVIANHLLNVMFVMDTITCLCVFVILRWEESII